MENNLKYRLFGFAVRVIKFLQLLPDNTENEVIRYQLAKSATSSGANYEESQSGSSKADFIYKVEISLKEIRESNYWLRIIEATNSSSETNVSELTFLINESEELKKILGSIIVRSKKNNN